MVTTYRKYIAYIAKLCLKKKKPMKIKMSMLVMIQKIGNSENTF